MSRKQLRSVPGRQRFLSDNVTTSDKRNDARLNGVRETGTRMPVARVTTVTTESRATLPLVTRLAYIVTSFVHVAFSAPIDRFLLPQMRRHAVEARAKITEKSGFRRTKILKGYPTAFTFQLPSYT